MLPEDQQRETEQHWQKQRMDKPAVIGALTAAAIPATDDIRIVSSKSTQTLHRQWRASGSAMRIPSNVATPLPPRNFSHTG